MSDEKTKVGKPDRDGAAVDIYTLRPIETPSEEHVLPRSLGGRLAKIGLIDKQTNDQLGARIDARLDEGLRSIRVIIDARSADGKPPRALSSIAGDDGKKYKVEAGGIMSPRPEITTTKLPSGELEIRGTVPNDEVVGDMLRNHAKRSGKNLEELVRGFTASAEHRVVAPPRMTFGLSLWNDEVYRATAKIACNFLAYAEPGLFVDPAFNAVREFVSRGTPLNTHPVQAVDVAIGDALGPLDHLVKVTIDATGHVVALVVYFGTLAFVVNIGKLSPNRAFSHSYRVDQLEATHRVDHEDDLRLPMPSFAAASAVSHEDFVQLVVQQVNKLLPIAHQIQRRLWLDRILEEPFQRFFEEVGDGEQTEEQRRALYGALTMRIVEELAPQLARESERERDMLLAKRVSDGSE